ncbi:MAG TPA: hypothetical protein PK014_06360 [Thermoanaerobaculia bacterium]|nr:hypothetical protein [Thermoanaerobaculia bacterium]HUM29375.1 hypothetical protein [Thermoanaerobaculia bacterium]HXK67621.1 hypothetical protein [Thermoanaerobaculia bacterium]
MKRFFCLFLFLVLALCVKGWYLYSALHTFPSLADPAIDSRYYLELAQQFREGFFIPKPEGIFLLSPGYSIFLAIISGGDLARLPLLYIIQIILGTLSLGLVFLLTDRLFGNAAAWCATILFFFYGPVTFFEVHALSEAVVTPVLLSMLFLGLFSRHRVYLMIAGLFLGELILLRPNALLFLPILFLWSRLRDRRWLIVLASSLPVLILLPLLQLAGTGQFFATSGQAGVALYMGNNPQSFGLFTNNLGLQGSLHDMARQLKAKTEQLSGTAPLTPREVNRYWIRQAIHYGRSDPLGFLRNLTLKIQRLMDTWEYALNEQWFRTRPLAARFFPVPFALILAAGMAGLYFRSAKSTVAPLLLWLLTITLSLLIYYPSSRHRFPLVPVLCIFGGLFLSKIGMIMKEGKWKPTLTFLIIFTLSSLGVPDDRRAPDPYLLHGQSLAALKLNRMDLAEEYLNEAMDQRWDVPFFHLLKGEIDRRNQRGQEAHREDLHAFFLGSSGNDLLNRLGGWSLSNRKWKLAESVFKRTIQSYPRSYSGYINLSQVYFVTGHVEAAWDGYQQALMLGMPPRPDYANLLLQRILTD